MLLTSTPFVCSCQQPPHHQERARPIMHTSWRQAFAISNKLTIATVQAYISLYYCPKLPEKTKMFSPQIRVWICGHVWTCVLRVRGERQQPKEPTHYFAPQDINCSFCYLLHAASLSFVQNAAWVPRNSYWYHSRVIQFHMFTWFLLFLYCCSLIPDPAQIQRWRVKRHTHRDMPANMCTELLGSGLHHWLPNKNQRLASHRIQDGSTIYLKQLTFIWFQSPMQITSGTPFVKLFWCPCKYMDVSYLYADTISLNPTIRFQVSDTWWE